MTKYIDVDNEAFMISKSFKYYQDQSLLIAQLNELIDQENRFLCVTRPRRFGKSMAFNMLNAYYSKSCDSKELFENLAIAKNASYSQHLNQYHVIRIDFNSVITNYRSHQNEDPQRSLIDFLDAELLQEFKELFPSIIEQENIQNLNEAIEFLHNDPKINLKLIFLMDEWDLIFRDPPYAYDQRLKDAYVDFLRCLFKSEIGSAFSLVYLTGILPIPRSYSESSLNNFHEYSMVFPHDLASFFGFTKEQVKQLCKTYRLSYKQMSRWYDGYKLQGTSIYNPNSIIEAIDNKLYTCYWSKTSASTQLFEYVFNKKVIVNEYNERVELDLRSIQFDLLHLMIDQEIEIDLDNIDCNPTMIKTKEQLFALMIYLGYLTFKPRTKYLLNRCLLQIPNYEIKLALLNRIISNSTTAVYGSCSIQQLAERSIVLLEAIKQQDADQVAKIVQDFHNDPIEQIAPTEYNNESSLRYTIQLLMLFAVSRDYSVEKEVATGKGFADLIYLPYLNNPQNPPIIMELKMNEPNAKSAIEQIKERNYKQKIRKFTKQPIYYVGINYDAKTKEHDCKIEIDHS